MAIFIRLVRMGHDDNIPQKCDRQKIHDDNIRWSDFLYSSDGAAALIYVYMCIYIYIYIYIYISDSI